MPAKNHLSKEQKRKLLKEMNENENAQIRERILILLLMNEGKTYNVVYGDGDCCVEWVKAALQPTFLFLLVSGFAAAILIILM